MKHFPASRGPAKFSTVSNGHLRAPITCTRTTAWLLAACLFSAGFFSGAILFGEALLRLTP